MCSMLVDESGPLGCGALESVQGHGSAPISVGTVGHPEPGAQREMWPDLLR